MSTLVFTYAGTPAFFNIVSEMRDPAQYTRALTVCQTTVTIIYIIVGTIVYYYCGSYVASPALGSPGPLIKKVGYGIALPGLLGSAILLSHVRQTLIYLILMAKLTLASVVACQAHLYPYPARIQTPHGQHYHPLGHVAGLYPLGIRRGILGC